MTSLDAWEQRRGVVPRNGGTKAEREKLPEKPDGKNEQHQELGFCSAAQAKKWSRRGVICPDEKMHSIGERKGG